MGPSDIDEPSNNPLAPGDRGSLVILNKDVFFGIKISNTLRGLGWTVSILKTTADFHAAMSAGTPRLGIIDMNAGVDWDVIAELTGDGGPSVPVLVFGSHLDVDGFRAAKAAGVTRVVSNGDFHREMVTLVERYARVDDK